LQSGFERPRASEIVLAPRQEYWFRVWAARGLLYVSIPTAEPAVLAGLHDPAWRVREICAKVARRRALGRAEPILTHLLDDRVLRVRAAAEAALAALVISQAPG
jgi:HEAT repeat protein